MLNVVFKVASLGILSFLMILRKVMAWNIFWQQLLFIFPSNGFCLFHNPFYSFFSQRFHFFIRTWSKSMILSWKENKYMYFKFQVGRQSIWVAFNSHSFTFIRSIFSSNFKYCEQFHVGNDENILNIVRIYYLN